MLFLTDGPGASRPWETGFGPKFEKHEGKRIDFRFPGFTGFPGQGSVTFHIEVQRIFLSIGQSCKSKRIDI